MVFSSPGEFRIRRYPGEGSTSKRGCCQKYLMTSFPESNSYCESNHGILVTRRRPISEISCIGFQVQNGVWPKTFDDAISCVRILLRIQPWYFCHKATSGSGDIQDRVPGPKGGVSKNIRSRHFLSQSFNANPAIVFSSPGDFRFRRYPG
jgi:hypothetical protein